MLQLKKAFKVCEWRSGFFERNHGSTTEYCVLLIDEWYLQKSIQ